MPVVDELLALEDLYKRGFLDEEEVRKAKAAVLGTECTRPTRTEIAGFDWAAAQVSRAIQSIDERRRERKEREEAEIARKQREAEQFTSWFDAMGNNQLKMATALAEHDTHFG